ncbi:hypothetical protein BDF19DRAFT_441320 [Syncephalis fuscata]|nr:hypothetical protein BDF19DRAFT_441320 [Syncephalis fuscata]
MNYNDAFKYAPRLLIAAPWQNKTYHSSTIETNYRILMLKRSARGAFSNMHAFPGGAMELADQHDNWSALMTTSKITDAMDLAYRICALRETFEESGILITEPSIAGRFSDEQLVEWRKEVYADPQAFFNICKEHQLKPAVDRLVCFQRWITPKIEKRRFDTRFYLIALNETESRQLGVFDSASCIESTDVDKNTVTSRQYHDGGETVASAWYTPKEALTEYPTGRLNLMPPQWCMLEELSQISKITDIERQLNARPIPTYSPEFHHLSDKTFCAVLQEDWRHSEFNKQSFNSSKSVHQLDFEIKGKVARIQKRIRQLPMTTIQHSKL